MTQQGEEVTSENPVRIPQRFVGLHNHTGFSPFDGLGYPDEHFRFCLDNGLDAHAVTEHGNMNSYAHAQLWVENWCKVNKDRPFKFIPGVEAYFHPDLEQWRRDKALDEQAKDDKKAAKKLLAKQEKLQTKLIAVVDQADETEEIEMTNALTIENEDETKSTKHFNPVNRRHHLVLLPKSQKGLQKIFSTVSQGYLKGFYRFPRIDTGMLREAGKDGDIVVTSACIGGFPSFNVFQEAQQYKFDELSHRLLDDKVLLEKCVTSIGNTYQLMIDAVGEGNYYLELQFNKLAAQNLVNRAIIEFAKRNGVTKQLIVTCDAHYFNPGVWKERELYKKLGFMNYQAYSPDSLPKSKDDLKCELYPKNASQVWDGYLKAKVDTSFYDDDIIRDAIERTHDIAHQVIGEVPPDRSPKFPNERLIPKGEKSFNHLVKLCKEGLIKRKKQDDQVYVDRLTEELDVIKKMKNSDYFISYQKIMELARNVCLVGPARGSGGGSLVAYVLYITDLDPIRWDLPFARFLSVYRKGAPDIDTDLSDRDKVLEQLRNFFGFENVVPISNYNTFKLKTLVKDIGKFYGISFDETNAATRTVEDEVRKAVTKHGDDKNLFVLTFDEAMGFHCAKAKEPGAKPVCGGCTDRCNKVVSKSFRDFIEKYPVVAESIKILFKQNRSLGRHAGGVLVCDDLPNKMPLICSGGEPQSPWVEGVNFKHLEYIGNFIKYDLLGLETLKLIERTIELILIKGGNKKPTFNDVKDWYGKHLSPDVIDFEDPKPFEIYEKGRWAGIFQLTSSGAQRLFMRAKPKTIIDIAALTSIYRPGPLAANVDKLWLEHEHEPYDWGHPLINETLKETRGLLVFQEGVMALANKVAGFPMNETDEVRRAIMKRSISGGEAAKKKVKELEDSFVNGCVNNGIPYAIAKKAYETVCFMSGYGFNKSHAVAYAIDSYWCAWLMTYYEEQWLSAYVESMLGNPDKKAKAFGEIKKLGYTIVPIDINHADMGWTVLPGKKFMPSLLSCKGVGETAASEIIESRPYTSIEDVLWNEDGTWRPSKFNKKAMETLIKVHAFDSLECVGEGRVFNSYNHMNEVIIENSDAIRKSPKKDPLQGKKAFYEIARALAPITEEWTRKEQVENRVEAFGSLDVSALMEPHVLARLEEKGVKPVDEWHAKNFYWFCVKAAHPKKTKTGKQYLQLEAVGPVGKVYKMNAWGWDGVKSFSPFAIVLAEVDRNDYGFSTTLWRCKELT